MRFKLPADLTNMNSDKDNKVLKILHYSKNTSDKLINASCQYKDHLRILIAQKNLEYPAMVVQIHKINFDRGFQNFNKYPKCSHDITNTKL